MLRMTRLLHERFGLMQLRGLQEPVIRRVLAGQDVLALMPTGAGKSLCYQLPALLLPGLCLVISPLLALMRDQRQRLERLGIPSIALQGGFAPSVRPSLQRQLRSGTIKVLMASPERVLSHGFAEWLRASLPPAGLGLLVVDEAHCIAEWGPAFRPAYAGLGRLRACFPEATWLAMTASADDRIRAAIVSGLELPRDGVIQASFNRPELFYRVHACVRPWQHALAFQQHWYPASAAIYYCQRRQETEWLALLLRAQGLSARAYHAGLPGPQRRAAEAWFLDTPGAVMAATIAFGMGIDKPDIRLVVHRDGPRSLAAYYQETGRAGRDGRSATALMLTKPVASAQEDGLISRPVVRPAAPAWPADVEGTPDDASPDLRDFISRPGCRRRWLLRGFGEHHPGACGACDHCHPHYQPVPTLRTRVVGWARIRGASDRARTGMG